ncbi:MAG: OmpH family outer membrane protein [Pseudohongiellaceae bacterium]
MRTCYRVILCISLLATAQATIAQDTKIGVLNPLAALFNSDAAEVVQQELEQQFEPDTQRAEALQEQLVTLQEEFEQNEAVMTEEEIRRMNSDAQDLQVQLQLIAERIQQAVETRNQQFVQDMREELAAAISDVVAEGGFDLIINAESTPYYDQVLDVTARVTAKLNESTQN